MREGPTLPGGTLRGRERTMARTLCLPAVETRAASSAASRRPHPRRRRRLALARIVSAPTARPTPTSRRCAVGVGSERRRCCRGLVPVARVARSGCRRGGDGHVERPRAARTRASRPARTPSAARSLPRQRYPVVNGWSQHRKRCQQADCGGLPSPCHPRPFAQRPADAGIRRSGRAARSCAERLSTAPCERCRAVELPRRTARAVR